MVSISEAQADSSTDSSAEESSSDDSVEDPSETTVSSNTKELNALVKIIYCYPPYWPLTERALQDLHLENAELWKRLRKLASGAISSTVSSTTPPTSAARPPNPLEEYAYDFNQLRRGFCALSEVWLLPSVLNQPYPEQLREIGPYHDTRYKDKQSKCEAVIAELYDFIPAKFHKHLEGSLFFADKVRKITVLPDCPHPHCL